MCVYIICTSVRMNVRLIVLTDLRDRVTAMHTAVSGALRDAHTRAQLNTAADR